MQDQATLEYPVARRAGEQALTKLRRIRVGLALSDGVSLAGALVALHLAQAGLGAVGASLVLTVIVASLIWVAVFRAFGLYRVWQLSTWEGFRRLLGATGLGIIVVMFAAPWSSGSLSRPALLWTWLFTLSLVGLSRGFFNWQIRRQTRDGRLALRTALVGTKAESHRIARTLSAGEPSFSPVGYVTNGRDGTAEGGLSALGPLEDLEAIIGRNDIECVFVASSNLTTKEVLRISRACREANVEMRVWANVPDILTPRLAIQPLHDAVALAQTQTGLTGSLALLKRSFDLAVASVGLLLTLPLLTAVAIAIRLTSRGPILFRQTRVTKDGRSFTMYKFRTMVRDPEQALAGKVVDLTEPFFKLKDDPRLTRGAPLLRRLSLDELPQLFNVIRGDMSIVGPRPLPIEQVEANLELLGPRHEVRCGITGWWQISGRSEIDSEEALRLDLFYIENWSIGLDIYILLRTFGAVLARKGAW